MSGGSLRYGGAQISQDIEGRGEGETEITAGLFIEDHGVLSFLAHSLRQPNMIHQPLLLCQVYGQKRARDR